VLALALAGAAPATASPVLELDGKRVVKRDLRFAGATRLPAPPAAPPAPAAARRSQRPPLGRATREALDTLLARGQIDQAARDTRAGTLTEALAAYKALTGTRRTELGAVLATTDEMAAAGRLTPSRLEPVFLTLERNREWWTDGNLLASGARVTFSGSQVIWQYYRGQGIQLQMLANFGRANALWSARRRTPLRNMLAELVPLAADRGGFPAWEYYFEFGGGSPPWSSGMSQGTAVQSLGRAGQLLEDPALTDLAARALRLFELRPPTGVRVDTSAGAHYLIYTFAPKLLVLNGHLQAVIGLFDLAQITGDPRAQALFAAGDAEARASVPRYDTGRWSLYSLEREADLGYHQLVTTFLQNLCERTGQAVYCDTAELFLAYEDQPPVVRARTARIRTGAAAKLKFRLDKISRVGVTVLRGGTTVFSTSAVVGRGNRFYTWSRPSSPGRYRLRVTATDLAGNVARPSERALRILKRKRR
jgi:hypothetical protein